jgi:AAA family ATP:ADP antiporter
MNRTNRIEKSEKQTSAWIYRFLRLFTVVHPGEAGTTWLLSLTMFLLFTGYYFLRPVRKALILTEWSPNLESYLGGAIAVLLIFVVKIFSHIASKVPRQKLITWVTLFFISNLILFYVIYVAGVSPAVISIIFYVWLGIFNLMVVAQFWGFSNDLYTEEAGKRLFPLIMFGANFGGLIGGLIAYRILGPLNPYEIMLVTAGMLAICIVLTHVVHNREIKKAKKRELKTSVPGEEPIKEEEKPLEQGGGFRLIFKSRYLIYIAFFILVLNFVNTNGEYILSNVAKYTATTAIGTGQAEGLDRDVLIGRFYSNFYNIMSIIAIFIQLFLVSRIFKWFGVRTAVFILPFIALGGYFTIGLGASLIAVGLIKGLENATDYSLMNTTKHSLFLITSREEKYKAKAATDTFFHRSGDVLSAILVFVCAAFFALDFENIQNISVIARINVVIVLVFILLGMLIAKEHKKRSAHTEK